MVFTVYMAAIAVNSIILTVCCYFVPIHCERISCNFDDWIFSDTFATC